MSIILFLDYVGVALFAATGALAASRKELDFVGFIFLATLTGVGGGTVRDVILDAPVFWIEAPVYILICAACAIAVYFIAHLLESRFVWVLRLDAVALAAYSVLGAWKGLEMTGSPVVAVVMGMMTAALGGILRDVVAGEPSVLMRKEIYLLAAMAGATVYVLAEMAGLATPVAASLGFAVALNVRGAALAFGWSLPVYRSAPGRGQDESLDRFRNLKG